MAHDHAHIDPESGDRRVSLAIWANALLTVAQIVGGVSQCPLAGRLQLLEQPVSPLQFLKSRRKRNIALRLDQRFFQYDPPVAPQLVEPVHNREGGQLWYAGYLQDAR